MSHVPDELADEFPEHKQRIHELKAGDARFARLFDSYHQLNRSVHRAETNIEPVDDGTMYGLRKQRMELKDQLYAMLTAS